MCENPSDEHPHAPASPGPAGTRVFGVLGGIASGKSTVARLLAGPDGVVLSADEAVHAALDSHEGLEFLRERFGREVLGPDGRVDRPALARLVFGGSEGQSADSRAREDLEGWTHPRVRARILERLSDARAAGIGRVVLDVPLLLENDAQHGFARLCDALVFVDTPEEVRQARVVETRGWPPSELARREALQMPLAEKRARADLVLPNASDRTELQERVAEGLVQLGLA